MQFGGHRKEKRIYLDYAAATPVRFEVVEAMLPYFSEMFGNPSSVHKEGAEAMAAVEDARERLARTLRVRANDITFTSGGTEANNLALFGSVDVLLATGTQPAGIEVISTRIEHPSILKVLEQLEKRGVAVRYIPLAEDGRIDVGAFAHVLGEKTALVTCAYANSEVGTVEDVKRLTRMVKKYNSVHGTSIIVHLDASQAPLWLSCDVDALGVDLMTLDAGKCYGPKGVGALVHRRGAELRPQLLGGGQESGLRAGTENVPLIVGCALAIEIAQESWQTRSDAVATLRDYLIDLLEKEVEGVVLNGSREHRLANNVNISIPGADSEFAVVTLDTKGIALSTKSACSGARGGRSTVVETITGDAARAAATLRFTLGEATSRAELTETVSVLKEHVLKMRKFVQGHQGAETFDAR